MPSFLRSSKSPTERKKIVKIDMMVLVLQWGCQILDHSGSQMLLRCVLFPFAHLHCVEVAILTVCQHPHFDSSFNRLFGNVLFQCRAALKFDHRLIDRYITPQVIELITMLVDHVNDWASRSLPGVPGAGMVVLSQK